LNGKSTLYYGLSVQTDVSYLRL